MAGAETVVPCFSVEKPEIPKRLFRGSKFLKWPKTDDVSLHHIFFLNESYKIYSKLCNSITLQIKVSLICEIALWRFLLTFFFCLLPMHLYSFLCRNCYHLISFIALVIV